MKFIFTRHTEKKFIKFAKIGLRFTKKDVLNTINNPEYVDKESDAPKIISSKGIDKNHVLRVVFKVEDDIITIITFYPAKRGRYYEDKKN